VLRRYAAIASPHLARLLDVGLWDGHLYYGMEFVPLGSLATPVHPLSSADKVYAMAGAARGLHALHTAGLLHRDIRPRTVLLHPGGGKLAGLGIVQLLAEDRRDLVAAMRPTGVRHLPVNDPAYVAQAVLQGEEATVATELFSMGATLHEALTGTSVYGDLPEDLERRWEHVVGARVMVSTALSDAERAVIERCLTPEAAGGFATAEEAAEALEAVAAALEQQPAG
jgi:eukaryotic-like serine/threonine-protein kinase